MTARLVALSERAELWSELPRLYAALGALAADDTERVELWLKTAQVLSEKLGDVGGGGAACGAGVRGGADARGRAGDLRAAEHRGRRRWTPSSTRSTRRSRGWRLAPPSSPSSARQLLVARARALAGRPGAGRRRGARLPEHPRGRAGRARARRPTSLAAFEALVAGGSRIAAAARGPALAAGVARGARPGGGARRAAARVGDARKRRPSPIPCTRSRCTGACSPSTPSRTRRAPRWRAWRSRRATPRRRSWRSRARRDRAEGPARIAIELEIAQVLLARTTRWRDALASLRAVLAEAPSDADGARAGRPAPRAPRHARRRHRRCSSRRATRATTSRRARRSSTRLLDAPADADDAAARRGLVRAPLRSAARPGQRRGRAGDRRARRPGDARRRRRCWDRAEELARALGRPDEVAALYEEVLARSLATRAGAGDRRARGAVLRGVVRGLGARRPHPRARAGARPRPPTGRSIG